MVLAHSQKAPLPIPGKTPVIRGQGSSFSQTEILGDFLPGRMLQLFASATAKKFSLTHPSPCKRRHFDRMRGSRRGLGICRSGWGQGKFVDGIFPHPTWMRGQEAGDTGNHHWKMLRVKANFSSLLPIFPGTRSAIYWHLQCIKSHVERGLGLILFHSEKNPMK